MLVFSQTPWEWYGIKVLLSNFKNKIDYVGMYMKTNFAQPIPSLPDIMI